MTTLVMCYDDRRKAFADISIPQARRFAQAAGLGFEVFHAEHYEQPYLEKLRVTEEVLLRSERVIYSDVDVAFRPGVFDAEPLFTGPFSVSEDAYGYCAGFMALRNVLETRRLLRLWFDLGLPTDPPEYARLYDQSTLKMLCEHFAWVRKWLTPIPATLVSNRESKLRGLIAHHVWGNDGSVERMNFAWF